MAFDTTDGSHLVFVDEFLPLLDVWFMKQGLALCGWFSLRFVGRSRAYLTPTTRCNMTCVAEFTGLRGFDSTPSFWIVSKPWGESMPRFNTGPYFEISPEPMSSAPIPVLSIMTGAGSAKRSPTMAHDELATMTSPYAWGSPRPISHF